MQLSCWAQYQKPSCMEIATLCTHLRLWFTSEMRPDSARSLSSSKQTLLFCATFQSAWTYQCAWAKDRTEAYQKCLLKPIWFIVSLQHQQDMSGQLDQIVPIPSLQSYLQNIQTKSSLLESPITNFSSKPCLQQPARRPLICSDHRSIHTQAFTKHYYQSIHQWMSWWQSCLQICVVEQPC